MAVNSVAADIVSLLSAGPYYCFLRGDPLEMRNQLRYGRNQPACDFSVLFHRVSLQDDKTDTRWDHEGGFLHDIIL